MKRAHYSHSKPHNYKIYVSGIVPATPLQVVFSYFSSFGGISLLDPESGFPVTCSRSDMLYRNTSLKKNYCVVQCQDKSTFSHILRLDHYFNDGSRFYCEPYKDGLPLIIKNNNTNKRRCFVRKVPSHISQDELVRILEEVAGPVESVIRYPNKSYHLRPPKHSSFSATFYSQDSLARLLSLQDSELTSLSICGQKVIIQKYDAKKANGKHHQSYHRQPDLPPAGLLLPTADSVPERHGKTVYVKAPFSLDFESKPKPVGTTISVGTSKIDMKRLITKPNEREYYVSPDDHHPAKYHDVQNIRMNVLRVKPKKDSTLMIPEGDRTFGHTLDSLSK